MMVFLVILLLILLNGYFSLAEIALVAVKQGQLEDAAERGQKTARKALALVKDPEGFLSAVQVGITLLGLVEGIYGGDLVATRLEPLIAHAGAAPWLAHTLSLVLGIGLITYLTIVIGELLPKSIALQAPLKVSLAIAPSLVIFSKIAYPFIRLLTWSTRALLHLLRIRTQQQEQVSEQDLLRMLSTAHQQGVLDKAELWLHQNVFAFGDLTAGRMMKPQELVRCADEGWDEAQLAELMRQYHYSRFPVCQGSPARITGVLSVKDFFLKETPRWQDRAQKPMRVPEDMIAKDVFDCFKKTGADFAIVEDEGGNASGIITMQDIMEGVFGDIPEQETYKDYFYALSEREWHAHGLIHLQRIRRVLSLDWLRDYETAYINLQELLEGELGHPPEPGEIWSANGVDFKITKKSSEQLEEVLIRLPAKSAARL